MRGLIYRILFESVLVLPEFPANLASPRIPIVSTKCPRSPTFALPPSPPRRTHTHAIVCAPSPWRRRHTSCTTRTPLRGCRPSAHCHPPAMTTTTMRRQTPLSLLTLLLLPVLVSGGGPSKFPCPGPKFKMGQGVSCTEVKLPPNLCNSCPLRAPNGNGQFKDCSDIYNTNAGGCLGAMQKYVDANPCDPVRKEALAKLKGNPNNDDARITIDYFLYSVCEQCCDCIPIGAAKGADLGKWVTYRGNCPAHAFYDICKVAPKFTHFVKIGQGTPGKFKNAPSACNMLNGWAKSPFFFNWLKNPKTTLTPKLSDSLASVLEATSCSSKPIWDKCFALESKQNNLGTPGTFNKNGQQGPATPEQPKEPETQQPETSNPQATTQTPSNPGTTTTSGPQCTCPGVIKFGCNNWDSKAKKCTVFGQKCFPEPNTKPNFGFAWPGACSGSTQKKTSTTPQGTPPNTGGDATTTKKVEETKTDTTSKPATKPPTDNTSSSGGKCDCNGPVKWGCTDWDSKAKKCNTFGLKCFCPSCPSYGSTLPACCQPGGSCSNLKTSVKKTKEMTKSSSCFPGDSEAILADGTPVSMANLRIGDRVQVDVHGNSSPVFLFSHRDGPIYARHLQLTLANGLQLTLSAGHHIPVGMVSKPAYAIRTGDTLATVKGPSKVIGIARTRATGLYNPHTLAGTIVVDGVVCSTYTTGADQKAAHALLAPLRSLFRAGAIDERSASDFMEYGATSFVV